MPPTSTHLDVTLCQLSQENMIEQVHNKAVVWKFPTGISINKTLETDKFIKKYHSHHHYRYDSDVHSKIQNFCNKLIAIKAQP